MKPATDRIAMVSRITVLIGVFIIFSASFMRQVSDFIKSYLGPKDFTLLLNLILSAGLLAFSLPLIKRHRFNLSRLAGIMALFTTGIILTRQIGNVIERIHILEYGILGWLSAKDCLREKVTIKNLLSAAVFYIIIGALDEVYQIFLPYRYFGWLDILYNILGGCWGTVLYILKGDFKRNRCK